MQNRENALKQWLQTVLTTNKMLASAHKAAPVDIIPLTGDASFRRYYRLLHEGTHYIVMDAPPKKETLRPFLEIGQLLQANQVITPTVYAADEEQGFALLQDFGDMLLLTKLQDPKTTPQEINHLYRAALATLTQMEQCHQNAPFTLPRFDKIHMHNELSLLKTWYLEAYLDVHLSPAEINLIETTFNWIVDEIAKLPTVFIHRDYHSRNIMLLDKGVHDESMTEDSGAQSITLGVIDFQDGMQGPIGYDLVSLLKDCYIQWPAEQVLQWLAVFYQTSQNAQQLSFADFKRAFDLCGLQRHLKVLGIFCRLYLRDGKANYLADLPLTRHYVMACLESYPELRAFYDLMEERGQLR